ncbi:MAG: FAD-dependent oxidoreductase [Actinobacteria bacterium]|nr:FAD-dependent oxidoreductase [Actinomycetota bacterium]
MIGAGFAGLTAARDLAKDGRRVLVVEARDRIGGRTWYRPFADTDHDVEMGGGWVDPVFNKALMREVERYAIPLAECPDGESQVAVLGGATYDSICPLAPADVIGLERALVPIIRDARRIDPEVPLDQQDTADLDVPLDRYLEPFDLPVKLRELIGAWNRTSGGCEEADISALHFLSWVPSLDGSAVTIAHFPSHVFADGTVSLADALLADAACDTAFDTPVEAVTQTAEGVEVLARGGARFRGRAAVIAVPLNCWGDIEFRPGLSPAKRAGAAIGQSGTTTKLWALATGLPEKLQGVGERATPLDTFTAQFAVAEGDLVVGFSTRERGLDATDPAAVEAALRQFAPDARVSKSDTHDWVADPFAKGTWCAAPAGLLSKHAGGLAADEGRLFFAGSDLSHAFRGWITAAVDSGGAAAARLTALLAD